VASQVVVKQSVKSTDWRTTAPVEAAVHTAAHMKERTAEFVRKLGVAADLLSTQLVVAQGSLHVEGADKTADTASVQLALEAQHFGRKDSQQTAIHLVSCLRTGGSSFSMMSGSASSCSCVLALQYAAPC
jgi:hypothetical protein